MLSTLVVHAHNKPDVLARIVLLFHRRAINIESLKFTRIKKGNAAWMRITVEANRNEVPRIGANLRKLVDVLLVKNITTRIRPES
jgi:acetolactate synthase-1/3 small subunit